MLSRLTAAGVYRLAGILRAGGRLVGVEIPAGSLRLAHRDIVQGLLNWRVWFGLAQQDIRLRYKRSVIGPFWIALGMVAMTAGLGLVFSTILHQEIQFYLPYLAAGLICWHFIATNTTEAPLTFIHAQSVIVSMALPLSVHVHRVLVRNILVLLHNFLAYIGLVVYLGIEINANMLYIIPGLFLLAGNMLFAGLLLSIVGARFRDLTQIIATGLQLAFFLTPIIWNRSQISGGATRYWIDGNPVYHLIEVVRAPMLGQEPPLHSFLFALVMCLLLAALSYIVFGMFRRRIPYWL